MKMVMLPYLPIPPARVWPAVICGLLSLSGCGGRDANLPETAPVSGTVFYQNKPVETGTILFLPESGERPGGSPLGQGGEFTLSTYGEGDGAVLGKHKVTIEAYDNSLNNLVPDKYGNPRTTPLTLEVKAEPNEFEIILSD